MLTNQAFNQIGFMTTFCACVTVQPDLLIVKLFLVTFQQTSAVKSVNKLSIYSPQSQSGCTKCLFFLSFSSWPHFLCMY